MAADIFLQMEWGATLFWKLVFCAGKLSDVLYVPPWAYRDSRGKGKFPTKLFPLRSIRQVLTQLNLEDTKI